MGQHVAEKYAQLAAGVMDTKRTGADVKPGVGHLVTQAIYDFSPDPKELLDYLLPLTVKTALFQAFLDAVTSENVARMVYHENPWGPHPAAVEAMRDVLGKGLSGGGINRYIG